MKRCCETRVRLVRAGFLFAALLMAATWIGSHVRIKNAVGYPGFCLLIGKQKFGAENGGLFWLRDRSDSLGLNWPSGLYSSAQALCEAERWDGLRPFFRFAPDGEIRVWIPLWCLLILSAAGYGLCTFACWRARRIKRDRCPSCAYLIAPGTGLVCSECGKPLK